jgi:hypothetical protein
MTPLLINPNSQKMNNDINKNFLKILYKQDYSF